MSDWHARPLSEEEKAELRKQLEEEMEALENMLPGDYVDIHISIRIK